MFDLEKILEARDRLKEKSPLVHAITHPIAINMVANVILFLGAKAICASRPEEVGEIVENGRFPKSKPWKYNKRKNGCY